MSMKTNPFAGTNVVLIDVPMSNLEIMQLLQSLLANPKIPTPRPPSSNLLHQNTDDAIKWFLTKYLSDRPYRLDIHSHQEGIGRVACIDHSQPETPVSSL